jgi:hypothetical protein
LLPFFFDEPLLPDDFLGFMLRVWQQQIPATHHMDSTRLMNMTYMLLNANMTLKVHRKVHAKSNQSNGS